MLKETHLKLQGEKLIIDNVPYKINEGTLFKVVKNKMKSVVKFEISVEDKILKVVYVNLGFSNFNKIERKFKKETNEIAEKLKEKFIIEEI